MPNVIRWYQILRAQPHIQVGKLDASFGRCLTSELWVAGKFYTGLGTTLQKHGANDEVATGVATRATDSPTASAPRTP